VSGDARRTGTITHWRGDFGFAKLDGSRDSVYVHASRLKANAIDPQDVVLGTVLKFDIVDSKKRPGAKEAGGRITLEPVPTLPPWWVARTSVKS
jgi:cold shock CspA family protein